jgi:hypothetical protein
MTPGIGQTISAADFNSQPAVGQTISADQFNQQSGSGNVDLQSMATQVPDASTHVNNFLAAGNSIAGGLGVQKLGQGIASAGREFSGATNATGFQEAQAADAFTKMVSSQPVGSPERASALQKYLNIYEPSHSQGNPIGPSDIPTQGQVDPGTTLSNRDVLGSVASTAGLLVGGGAGEEAATTGIKQGIIQGAKTGLLGGATSGALQGLGSGLQNDQASAGQVAGETATGAAVGGVLGGAIGGITGGIGNAVKGIGGAINDIKAENSPQAIAEAAGAPKGAAQEVLSNPKSAQTAASLAGEANPQQKVLENVQSALNSHSQKISSEYTAAFKQLDNQFPNTTLKLDAQGRTAITSILQDYPSVSARFQSLGAEFGPEGLNLNAPLKPSQGFSLLKALNGIYDDVSANPDMRSGEEKVALRAVGTFRQELISQLDGKMGLQAGEKGPVESILNNYQKGVQTNSALRKLFGATFKTANDPAAQDNATTKLMSLFTKDKVNTLNALDQIGQQTGNPTLKNQIATLHMLDNPGATAKGMTTSGAIQKALYTVVKNIFSLKGGVITGSLVGGYEGIKHLGL